MKYKNNWQRSLTTAEIIQGGFSTPWDSPMIPNFDFTFRNAEILTIVYRSDLNCISKLLPPPLIASSDYVMVHIYQMNDTEWIGSYNESNIMVGVKYQPKNIEGGYSTYLFLDSPIGISQGREVHGQPKKYAEPKLIKNGDTIIGKIVRNDIEVLNATTVYKQTKAKIEDLNEYFSFTTNINLKVIDHITGKPAIRQLTARKIHNLKVYECWRGPATLEIRPHVQAPLFQLPVIEMLESFYWKADFTLVPGEIIHNYLTNNQENYQ